MGDNGSNAYDVTFGRIMFLQKIIAGHNNVRSFERHDDLVFDVTRIEQRDTIQVICVDEYALSEAMARKVISDFPDASIIFVGGKWNRPTGEAEAYCRTRKIGICNAGDINAALSKTRYWR
jgi:hypothetical protein